MSIFHNVKVLPWSNQDHSMHNFYFLITRKLYCLILYSRNWLHDSMYFICYWHVCFHTAWQMFLLWITWNFCSRETKQATTSSQVRLSYSRFEKPAHLVLKLCLFSYGPLNGVRLEIDWLGKTRDVNVSTLSLDFTAFWAGFTIHFLAVAKELVSL